jgi:anti-sigma B factor antagonist
LPHSSAIRSVADISIVDVSGRITIGEGSASLRETVHDLMERGFKRILLNLHEVGYLDSSGLGELVWTYTSVLGQGGQMKLLNPSKRVNDLLQMSKLSAVFDVQLDEASALHSFGERASTREAM